ncbi:hypothetical protein Aduo_011962 [Ancylostoma duodenale]
MAILREQQNLKGGATFAQIYACTGLIMAHLSTLYRTAWMGWGYVIDPEFALMDKYPFVTTLIAPAQT